jgi:hypothetical protein
MNWMRRICILHWSIVVFVLLAACGLLFGPVMADEPPKEASAPAQFQSIKLKYAKASDTAKLLQSIFTTKAAESSIKLVADESANSVLIYASAAQIAEIREILKNLDMPREEAEAPPPKISIYELRSLEPDKALEDSLRLVFAKKTTANFSVDKTRKCVIVSADNITTDAVEALLMRLEAAGTSRPDEDVQVRVVWFVSVEGDDDKGPPLADDLKEVAPGLAKLGINKPRVAAQFMVNAQPNTQFQAKGTAKLGAVACNVSVLGRLNNRKEPPGLEIAIQAARGGGAEARATIGTNEICNIQTDISAPFGHLVVLGVTPTEGTTSAFVVQVLRKEAKKPTPKK